YTACTSPQSYTNLSVGSHTFRVKATDQAGNTDTTPDSFAWTITAADTTPPVTTISTNPTQPTNATTHAFSFTSNEANSTFQCKLARGPFSACTSPVTYTNLTGGSHTVTITATDTAANPEVTGASKTWTIDLTNPTITVAANPTTVTTGSTNLTATAS